MVATGSPFLSISTPRRGDRVTQTTLPSNLSLVQVVQLLTLGCRAVALLHCSLPTRGRVTDMATTLNFMEFTRREHLVIVKALLTSCRCRLCAGGGSSWCCGSLFSGTHANPISDVVGPGLCSGSFCIPLQCCSTAPTRQDMASLLPEPQPAAGRVGWGRDTQPCSHLRSHWNTRVRDALARFPEQGEQHLLQLAHV